jgi:N-acetyl-alpha-D-glucosaminyl L-malate synthase BshA
MTANRRLPFVTTLHGTDITLVGTDPSYFSITKFSIEQSDGITAISKYLEEQTVGVFGVTNPIHIIHNFVNCDLYRPAPDRRPKVKQLIHLSNFRPVKRVADCIRILSEVCRSTPANLLMVGDGPERGQAELLARQLGVADRVTFLGKQNHVERLIPEAHVLLMPSEMESFGLAALEAMACGVPPVATQTGGVPELITDGLDGFLSPVGDVAAQAARVVSLLTDDSRHERMAAAARHTAMTRYSTSMIIPQYERCYEEVCGS